MAAAGGAGVDLLSTGSVLNTAGTVMGGAGGVGGYGIAAGGDGGVGGAGIDVAGLGTIENQGVIAGGSGGQGGSGFFTDGYGGAGRAGVVLAGGGTLVNDALIEGAAGGIGGAPYGINGPAGIGVYVTGSEAATVTNAGTIEGGGGIAVEFKSAADRLAVLAGATFEGAVLGGDGALELASGVGVISSLFGVGDDLVVCGSMARTTFQNFGTVAVDAGATFGTTGSIAVGAGQAVESAGSLTLGGGGANIVNDGLIEATGGTLAVDAVVTGSGEVDLAAGKIVIETANAAEAVAFAGQTGTLQLDRSRTYSGDVSGFSPTGGTTLDLRDIGFVSAHEASFSGTKTSGVLTVSDGTHTARVTLLGDYTNTTFVASSDGKGGVDIVDPNAPPPSLQHFVSVMAGFGSAMASAPAPTELWAARGPTLVSPRHAIA